MQLNQGFAGWALSDRGQRWLQGAVILALLVTNSSAIAAEVAVPSPVRLSTPSLWWVQDWFVKKDNCVTEMILNWTVQSPNQNQPGQVNLVLDRQLWRGLGYIERYKFVNDFGLAAQRQGYNVRVIDNQSTELAEYFCEASTGSATAASPCRIALEFSGKANIRGATTRQCAVAAPTPIDTEPVPPPPAATETRSE